MLVLRLGVVVVGLVPTLPHRGLLASGLFLLMAPFMAGIQTVFQSSCQRFTTKRSRSAGFNLWYLFMNIGAAAAGFSVDIVRKLLHLPNVHIFTMGVVTALLCLVVGMTMIKREDQLVGPEEAARDQARRSQSQAQAALAGHSSRSSGSRPSGGCWCSWR